MQYTEEQVKEKYNSLPKEVKEAITSVDTTKKIVDISDKYKISIDGAGELVDETGLVMLGLTKPDDFVNHVKKRLEISEDLARVLVKEINDDILISIRESLRKIQEKEIIQEREKTENLGDEIVDNKKGTENHIIKPRPESLEEKKTTEKDLYSGLNKEQIIKEVENPLGFQDEVKEIQENQEITKPAETSLSGVKKTELVESNLNEATKTPITREENQTKNPLREEDKKPQPTEEKKPLDPYREPID